MLKKGLIKAMSAPIVLNIGNRCFSQHVPVFMLHRFKLPGAGSQYTSELHEVAFLEFALEWLRRKRYTFVSVDDVAKAIKNGEELPPKSIAFTLDDGYWDQFEASTELFAKYDCPATFYVATGFINEEIWFWDSKAEYLFDKASQAKLDALARFRPNLKLEGASVQQALHKFIASLKLLSYEKIEEELAHISSFFEVPIPAKAPRSFGPASWSEIRAARKRGMVIGAHSHTHPLLSRESHSDVERQINQSRDIIQEQVGSCSGVFCYPVGRVQDFGSREEAIARRCGFDGAVSAIPRYANLDKKEELYRIPRFGLPRTEENFIQYASWIEAFKTKMR